MDVANSLSLSSRALRLELDTLSRLKLPAILHWSGNHFVVLESISGSSVVIHDPARGRRNIKHSELSASFTGVALEFTKVSDFQMVRARIPVHMRDLWNRIHGLKFAITQVLLLSIIFQIVTFSLPLQLQLVIDESLAHSDSEILFVIAVGFLGLFAFQAIVQATRDWVMQLFGQQFILQIIGNLTRHLLKLPSSYFEKRHLGDIMSRMQSIRVIQDIVLRGVIGALIDGIMACVALALLFF
jgi:ATP-binding cassette subfamily B protein RaxB